MSDLSSQYADFTPTNSEAFRSHKPENKQFRDGVSAYVEGIPLFAPVKDDWSHIRIMPWRGGGYFAKESRQHRYLGPTKSNCACPVMRGEPICVLCNKAREAWNAQNEELGRKIGKKTRYSSWVINRKSPHDGPMIWDYTEQTLIAIRGLIEDPETGQIISLDHLDQGYDLFFKWRKETTGSPFYTANDISLGKNPRPTPLGTPEQVAPWMGFVRGYAFEDLWNYIPDEQMLVIAGLQADSYAEDGFNSQVAVPASAPSSVPEGPQPPDEGPAPNVPGAGATTSSTPASAATTVNPALTPPAPSSAPAATTPPSVDVNVNKMREALFSKTEE